MERSLENLTRIKQKEIEKKHRYLKVKVGSMRRSMISEENYMKEAEISDDEEDNLSKDRQVELLESLSHVPSSIANFVLVHCQKGEPLQSYALLLQAGLHRHFSEMVAGTDYENLFQAIEFRRFGMLDDYLYHLELCLQLQNMSFHFELCCEAVCLLAVRLMIDTTHKKSVLIDQSILRYFNLRGQ